MQTKYQRSDDKPWWRYGHLWLVIAGPVIVVVASFITLYLAVSRKDPVLDEDYYRKSLELNKSPAANSASLAPATDARNHAATGVPAEKTAP